jgi:hypothetical protein
MSAYRTSSATNPPPFAAQNSMNSQPSQRCLTTDGFDFWWKTTSARHVALTVEADALIRAHRRASSASQLLIRKAH